jgi:thioredoxin-dependent peroxiredoxin
MLSTGIAAPAFSVPDQHGQVVTLKELLGKWILLCFYPKDDTPTCTKEVCAFRDTYSQLEAQNCVVFGINADTVETHAAFATKHHLPFLLLADPTKAMLTAYEAWQPKQFLGLPGVARISYLIDPAGQIVKSYTVTDALTHAEDVLQDLHTLQRA